MMSNKSIHVISYYYYYIYLFDIYAICNVKPMSNMSNDIANKKMSNLCQIYFLINSVSYIPNDIYDIVFKGFGSGVAVFPPLGQSDRTPPVAPGSGITAHYARSLFRGFVGCIGKYCEKNEMKQNLNKFNGLEAIICQKKGFSPISREA